MKTAILILFAAAAFAQTSDSDRLKIRDAQRIAAETVAARNALESQYWQAVRAVDQAQANVAAVIAQVGKDKACEIDPKTADCSKAPAMPRPSIPGKP
jgi:Tfp pilus assembly protein FimT